MINTILETHQNFQDTYSKALSKMETLKHKDYHCTDIENNIESIENITQEIAEKDIPIYNLYGKLSK